MEVTYVYEVEYDMVELPTGMAGEELAAFKGMPLYARFEKEAEDSFVPEAYIDGFYILAVHDDNSAYISNGPTTVALGFKYPGFDIILHLVEGQVMQRALEENE
jgi:hypothetical protein